MRKKEDQKMSSEEIFANILNELNSIKDIIEKNKDLSPRDVPYLINKISNRIGDLRDDYVHYSKVVEEEDSIGICEQ